MPWMICFAITVSSLCIYSRGFFCLICSFLAYTVLMDSDFCLSIDILWILQFYFVVVLILYAFSCFFTTLILYGYSTSLIHLGFS